MCRAPPPLPEQSRRGWDPEERAPGFYMLLIGRSLDRFKWDPYEFKREPRESKRGPG